LPSFWDNKDIDVLEDELLRHEIIEYKEDMDNIWEIFKALSEKYSDICDS